MFRKIRIALLLYVLLLVAAVQYVTLTGSTDWDQPLWVDIWLIDADHSAPTQRYVEHLDTGDFAAIETFFAAEARRYGVAQPRPFRIQVAGMLPDALPALPRSGDWLGTIRWSLVMRWFTARLHWGSERPTPDITIFAQYHASDAAPLFDRSTALRKGMLVIANVFASPRMHDANQLIIAHELLHTLGAIDKYDPLTNQPLEPIGLAAPQQSPRYPQSHAEIMAGRIARSAAHAEIPAGLDAVVVGPATAYEIGWLDTWPLE